MANEIIDLSKNGSIGVSSNNAFASLGYSADLELEFCNGFNLQMEASAFGEVGISKHVGDFFETIIEIEAGVEAGIRAAMQLSPDILDDLGLTASIKAYIKAYIRARLELLLKMNRLLSGVQQKSSSLQYNIFKAFTEQLEVGVGVEANAQVALTAAAEIICKARMIEDQGKAPGFDFRVNAEAAFIFGAGFDFFTMARFANISGFFKTSKDLILEEIKNNVSTKNVLTEKHLDFAFSTWSTLLDLIIDASIAELEDKKSGFLSTLKTFSIDFIFSGALEAYKVFLEDQVIKLSDWIEQHVSSLNADLNIVSIKINQLIHKLNTLNSEIEVIAVVNDVIELGDSLNYDHKEELKEIGTHLYMFGYLFDTTNESFWRQIPDYAKQKYADATGIQIRVLNSRGRAYNYLSSSCFTTFLKTDFPGMARPLKELVVILESSGLNVGEFLEILLDKNNEEAKKSTLDIGIRLVQALFDNYLADIIRDKIKPEVPDANLVNSYQSMVIEDLLNSFSATFIPLLKLVFVNNGSKKDIENLTYVANRYLLGLFARNIAFMTNELLNYTTENITNSINQCEQSIRGGSFTFMANKFFDNIKDKIDNILPFELPGRLFPNTREALLKATNEFILDILDIARTSMGRETWTEGRINIISGNIEAMLFSPDNNLMDLRLLTAQEVRDKIEELRQCNFLPSVSKAKLKDVADVLQKIGWSQVKAYLLKMPLALLLYFLKLLKVLLIDFILEILDALYQLFKELLERLIKLIGDLIAEIARLVEKLAEALIKLGEAIADAFNALAEAIGDLFDNLLDLLDFSDLNWLDDIGDFIVSLFGGLTQEEKAEKTITELRRKALQNLDRQKFETAMTNSAKRGTFNLQFYNNWIQSNILKHDIMSELQKVKLKGNNTVSSVWAEARRPSFAIRQNLNDKALEYARTDFQIKNRQDALNRLERRKLKFDLRLQQISLLNPEEVTINSPLKLDIEQDDIPIYGKYVFLDINFGNLDVGKVLHDQFKFNCQDLVDINDELSANALVNEVKRTRNPENLSLLQVKIILNGNELNLQNATTKNNRLRGHLHKSLLKQGNNDLFVLVITPSEFEHKMVTKHVQFFCEHSRKKRPSNAVFIDLKQTVINTKGDDHLDAPKRTLEDKEKVVITNNSDKEVNLDGWKLSDAAGHTFVFNNHRIKPNNSIPVYVGNTASIDNNSWIAKYHGQLIAILNNKGEFLKLEDQHGKVVSHVYTGSPSTNKHINFLSFK